LGTESANPKNPVISLSVLKDWLGLIFIPVLIWAWSIDTKLAVQTEKISELTSEISSAKETSDKISETVQENQITIARLEGKTEATGEKIDALTDMLSNR
jgi:uncharacterized coiled-coil protein SlyX